jgi:hypothetical protein
MKPDVFIATPAYSGDVAAGYCQSFWLTDKIFAQNGLLAFPLFLTGNADIACARGLCVHKFLESGAEYLFFIDSDLAWDPAGALALVKSPHEFVAGVYPAKVADRAKVFQSRNLRETATRNYIETDGVPGGFMRIKRAAIEKMVAAYPEVKSAYLDHGVVSFLFDHLVAEDGVRLGEDYAFCERWRRIGGKIFIYPDISFAHFGRAEWHGNMIEDHPRLRIEA